jgi:hypothetical protein
MVLKGKDRGARDDWEALQIVLQNHPTLRMRVLHRLRALKGLSHQRKNNNNKPIEKTREERLQERKKNK